MSVTIPERFTLARALREDRHSRTFVGNDHLLDNKEVVVKILKTAVIDTNRASLTEHFSRLIGVKHNQLATVFDVGLTKRHHLYYVREYLTDPAWIINDPIGTMRLLVSAVSFLSIGRLTHGGIKPSNIFVTKNNLKLTDAKPWLHTHDDEESLHFTAPEILLGEQPSREADLYSLGAALYYLLTGQHLFEDPDLDRLKSKYCFAFVQPVPFFWSVSQHIAELVLQLLNRDPARRTAAFDQLKAALDTEALGADRAPFVGQQDLLKEIDDAVQRPRKILRALLIEGEIGSGKSRFLQQVRIRLALRKFTFITCSCSPNSDNLSPVWKAFENLSWSGLVSLPEISRFLGSPSSALSDVPAGDPTGTRGEYTLERTMNDVIGVLASIARQAPVVMILEDVQYADFGTAKFLQWLAARASDLPMTLFLTGQSTDDEPGWVRVVESCLGDDFLRLRIPALPRRDCEVLVQLLTPKGTNRDEILQLAAGNPLLIEHYAKCSSSHDDNELTKFAASILSNLKSETYAILQVLSVFRKPVSLDSIVRLCQCDAEQANTKLQVAKRLGLILIEDGLVQNRFPIVQKEIYASLSKRKKQLLNRDAFIALLDVESNREVLGDHAFEARLFSEATALYRELAINAYSSQNHKAALRYYQRLRTCNASLGQAFTPREKLDIALVYGKLGKPSSSHRIYGELLHTRKVQSDPDLLSLIYYRQAITTPGITDQQRSRLLRKAIRCLPDDASYPARRMYICIALSRIGERDLAWQGLKNIEEYPMEGEKNIALLNATRATLLIHNCEFRAAVEYYQQCTSVDRPVVLNNISYCFAKLGDLQTALEYELQSREEAVRTGAMFVELQSLDNIAAIRIKRGEMREAESLLNLASAQAVKLTAGDMLDRENLFRSISSDYASYATHTGQYSLAEEHLHKQKTNLERISHRDQLLCEIVRCKFLIQVCHTNEAHKLLEKLKKLSIFAMPYLQIERTLLEAHLPTVPTSNRLERLQHALGLSVKLDTRYQYCELLLSLTCVQLELNDKQAAQASIDIALDMATNNGYKLLAAHAHLLLGMTLQDVEEKQRQLLEALRLASEMGLQELIAEVALHLGVLNLEGGNIVTAREYLIRSTTITARLAEGVPNVAKAKYLAKKWRRDAIQALDRCNESMPLHAAAIFNLESDKYFDGAYRLTMSAASVNSADGLFSLVEKTLVAAINRSAVVIAQHGRDSRSMTVRIKMSTELAQRIDNVAKQSKGRVFFESDQKTKQSIGWVPFNSETWHGGIYVICRSHEPQFSEKEIELLTMIGTIASTSLKRLEARNAQEAQPQELTEFHGIIGASKAIREVYSQIQMAAGNTANVRIEGESGTGKELVAKAIHAAGPRAKEPFIAVDCGAIPEGLIEAELFGAKKGSYTGAVVDRPGLFEAANRGTIFLDEISNTTLVLQAKLLRVIQEREVRRIGETKGRTIDVRLMVASNQNLEALVEGGKFRKDLLYRLNVLHIKVPPLRTRREDIPMLAHAFLKKLNTTNNTKKYFVSEVIEHLCTQQFSGNVRELQNAIERGFFLAKGIMITRVPLEAQASTTDGPADEVQTWFKEISEGRKDFWSAIHNRYKRRDISREKVVAFVDFGLRSTRGSYKTMASSFRLKEKEYRRFMDFLRRNDCLLDFRPYRKAATATSEN